ncbi:rna-directed dna polymerase from mobile element jockey- hypothetical protein [Limosa lapponica baueri]|uniref:Reverse transcriptase domain-containing protein n=1 Tax=Limosa lapponica baueri TaxID=1758121 RepID=A0A2I0TVR9_LIMLA|nr:rna-directed dna polymerase from mobile element jockey- hypothetical protein [Limosa lapponica baueri]
MKEISCLINLIAFYNKMTSLVDKTIAVDFSKAFDTVSDNMFIDTLKKYGLAKRIVRTAAGWLKERPELVAQFSSVVFELCLFVQLADKRTEEELGVPFSEESCGLKSIFEINVMDIARIFMERNVQEHRNGNPLKSRFE